MESFEEFVHTRSQAFFRLAYVLTREHTLAEDLRQTTLAKVWPVWKRISGDSEPYVRRALVNTYNSWCRRRWDGEHPTGDLPERSVPSPESLVDDRDEVWRALARLPKRQRAVLVMRHFEDLSEAEIASTLDMAPGTVKSYAAKGLATLRADPAKLSVPPAPAATERLAAVRERVKHRRRAIVATTAAVIAIIVMLFLQRAAALTSAAPSELRPRPAERTVSRPARRARVLR
ncbi:SigE family RNA polymerase sigma factor [Catelliglobosispora koreensis]|uniref:SigE family RNA polymerase sigma factor n=1 Tax=Catelliglobosispora koreensis TaxID=129052 RepID=UPI0003626257|nr:SigE family RNA polymerase sigma factor [Catelliglobosispora koreensis]